MFFWDGLDSSLIQIHSNQYFMKPKRLWEPKGILTSLRVVKRDHLGVVALQLSFEGIVEKRMKKHKGRPRDVSSLGSSMWFYNVVSEICNLGAENTLNRA